MSKGMKSGLTWLLLLTVGFGFGARYFSNLANTPDPSISQCTSTGSCTVPDLITYGTTQHNELHWATVMIVLAVISGILLLSTVVAAIQTYLEKKPED